MRWIGWFVVMSGRSEGVGWRPHRTRHYFAWLLTRCIILLLLLLLLARAIGSAFSPLLLLWTGPGFSGLTDTPAFLFIQRDQGIGAVVDATQAGVLVDHASAAFPRSRSSLLAAAAGCPSSQQKAPAGSCCFVDVERVIESAKAGLIEKVRLSNQRSMCRLIELSTLGAFFFIDHRRFQVSDRDPPSQAPR